MDDAPEVVAKEPVKRPYFIPSTVSYDNLPADLQTALISLVGPIYDQHVVQARSPLERSAGASLAFLLTLEVLDQFALMQMTNFDPPSETADTEMRQKKIERHLRLLGAKANYGNFLTKLETLRATALAGPRRERRI